MLNPFDLDNEHDYQQWREQKLINFPAKLEDIIIEVKDPRALTRAEHQAMVDCCRRANMVLYSSGVTTADKQIPLRLGHQFGLQRLNHNWLADEDAITSLTVNYEGSHPHYIPYTNRPIRWHTDGYYNPPQEQVNGLLLHCVEPATEGGENQLLDHEIAYIQLRDMNPQFIDALMQPGVMSIPPRMEGEQVVRHEQSGPVFSIHPVSGHLHMRYTARTRSICWAEDPVVQQAVSQLEALCSIDNPYVFRGRLEAGMGLVSNNVLHDRAGFTDGHGQPRLLYRARYLDRIDSTNIH